MINWAEKVRKGLPFTEFPILDSHDHLGRWIAFHVAKDGTIEQMINCMDRTGINKVFVTAHASIGPDYVYGNDMVFDAIKKYPDRVMGYVTINPNYPEDMQHELDRCFSRPGFRGIKLHPSCHGMPVDEPNFHTAYEYANEHELPVLIHIWGAGHVACVEHLSREYPNARFLMGHFGADPEGMKRAIKLINNRDNVYGDTAISMGIAGNIEWLVRETNPKRILFGTDMPFYEATFTVGRVAMADIPDEVKIDIFGGNLQRILDKTDR